MGNQVLVAVAGSALSAHPGQESTGVVKSEGEWCGRQVLVPRLLCCGECGPCMRSKVAACESLIPHGPPKPELTVPTKYLLPLGAPLFEGVVPSENLWFYAPLADTYGAPYDGLVRAGAHPGEVCVVLGSTYRAVAAAQVARAMGCHVVIACKGQSLATRLSEAPYGFDGMPLDSMAPGDARAEVSRRAQRIEAPAHGIHLLETTGTDAGRAFALAMLGRGDTLLLLDRPDSLQTGPGIFADLPGGPQVSVGPLCNQLCEVQGRMISAKAAHPDLYIDLYAMVRRGELDPTLLVTKVTPDSPESTDPLRLSVLVF